tara:strand:- start:588 stop:902 length:315 start_codon:yes stop_codon:yes gene_type:complete
MPQTLEKATERNVQKINEVDAKLQEELICAEVMERLGTVNLFYKIAAINVFDNRWRVNVWVEDWSHGGFGCTYKIKHSYFCTVQENCISKSNPEIPQQNEKSGV